MKFTQLKDYLSNKMLMQHVYQPVMIRTLLESKENGASVETIARLFLLKVDSDMLYGALAAATDRGFNLVPEAC